MSVFNIKWGRRAQSKLVSLIVGTAILSASTLLQAATIYVSPASVAEPVGGSFTLMIKGTGFTVGDHGLGYSFSGGTSGGGLDISWDPTILTLTGYDISMFPGDKFFAAPAALDNAAGTLTGLSVLSFIGTSFSDFDVASLSFTTDLPGSTALTLGSSGVNVWTDFNSLVDMNPNYIGATIAVNSTATTVPVPSAVWLFTTGIIGLIGVARRQSARA